MALAVAIEFNKTFFLKFLKFGVVGFSGLIVDFSITWLCKERLKIHKYLASSLGFIVATCTNYTLNRFWTFNNHDPASIIQFSKFFTVAIVGLISAMPLFTCLTTGSSSISTQLKPSLLRQFLYGISLLTIFIPLRDNLSADERRKEA